MAKLVAPLFSFGASGKLGNALVFFPWKGLDVVRSYVVPTNPNTAGQIVQRGYMADAVDDIHYAQTDPTGEMVAADIAAYRALAALRPTPRTWFNELVKQAIDQWVAGDDFAIGREGGTTPGVDELAVTILFAAQTGPGITAGDFWYGLTPTAMINSEAAAVAAQVCTATIAALVTGTKYYWQFRPTAPAGQVNSRSGIYYGVAG